MEYYTNRLSVRTQLIEKLTVCQTASNIPLGTDTKKFSADDFELTQNLFNKLERKLCTEMQHQIDGVFLDLYVKEKLIPRGLQVNLQPTFKDINGFVDEWNKIIDECSLNLMRLISVKRNSLCILTNVELNAILCEIEKFRSHGQFMHYIITRSH